MEHVASPAAEEIASALYHPDRPLAPTVVLIPIAAEQEEEVISGAMAAYAHQRTAEPFSIVLLLNHRAASSSESRTKIGRTIDEASRLQRAYDEMLDIRIAIRQYDVPTIGQIRKDLWDGAMFLAATQGAFDDPYADIIGINHDIDTIAINSEYISNVQATYAQFQRQANSHGVPSRLLPPRFTHVRHSLPYDTHPVTAQAIFWMDACVDAGTPYVPAYEEGLVVPFSRYAQSGGFSPTAETHETQPLVEKAGTIPTIAGTAMWTSPRRYIDRFPLHGYEGIWQAGSFGALDQCRETPGRDATREELALHTEAVLNDHLGYYYLDAAVKRTYSRFTIPRITPSMPASSVEALAQQTHDELWRRLEKSLGMARSRLITMGLGRLSVTLGNTNELIAPIIDETMVAIPTNIDQISTVLARRML